MLVNYSKISYYFVVEAMSLMDWSKNEKYGSEVKSRKVSSHPKAQSNRF